VETYKVLIQAKDKFSKQFSKATAGLKRIGGAAKSVGKVIGGLGLAVAAAATAFIALGKKSFDALDAIAKTADRTGIAAEKLQALRLGAVESGATVEDLNKSMEKFAKNIGDVVVKGTGEATYALDKMGIQLRDNSGRLKTTDTLLTEVVGGIGKLGSEAERASTLMALFGKPGLKLNWVLGKGVEAMEEWNKKAKEMGIIIDAKALKSIENFNDRFAELKFISNALVNQTFAALAPVLEGLITQFTAWRVEVNKASGGLEKMGEQIATKLLLTFADLIEGLGSTVKFLKQTSLWITHVTDSLKAMANLNPVEVWKDLQKINQAYQDGLIALEDYDGGTKKIADALRAMVQASIDGKIALEDLNEDGAKPFVDTINVAAEAFENFGNGFNLVFNDGKDKFDAMAKLGQKVGKTLEKGLTDAFMNIGKGAEGLKDLMDTILKQIMAELIRVFIVQAAVQGVKTYFGGRAHGGPVTGGKTYLVGERGPELFTPPGNGNIVPNGAMAGGGSTNVNISYNITAFDAQSATTAIAAQAPTIVGIVEQSFRKRGRLGPIGG
tara:strand:+ start:742 stop:2406 length:1665 start_codon:yes stop_codon:yes gene_type:complete